MLLILHFCITKMRSHILVSPHHPSCHPQEVVRGPVGPKVPDDNFQGEVYSCKQFYTILTIYLAIPRPTLFPFTAVVDFAAEQRQLVRAYDTPEGARAGGPLPLILYET